MPRAIAAPFDVDVDLDLGSFLLRRRGAVAVAPGELLPAADPWSVRGLVALDADLARRGYLLTTQLRTALARLAPGRLAELGDGLLARIDHLLGADREHQPLFRCFPDAVPDHAHALYTRQIRAFLLNQPRQPCAHCGRRGAEAGIGALAPCAHLLCAGCFDGLAADGRGGQCPLCGASLSAGTYLAEDSAVGRRAAEEFGGEQALRPLRLLAADQLTAAMAEFHRLLARRTPLSPQDRDDLAALLAHAPEDLPQRLPAQIPLRETKAVVLAALLRRGGADALPVLAERIDTATDVLRLLWAWSGAEPDLLRGTARRLRLRSLPRPLRRGLLEILEGLHPTALAEDLPRHRSAWLRAGELLHPYEHRRHFPKVTAAFVLLRETDLRTHGVGREFAEPPAPLRVVTVGERTRLGFTGFAGRVEARLAAGDTAGAVRVLAERPGELVRRLHHVLRVHAAMTPPGTPSPGAQPAGTPPARTPLPEELLETVAGALTRVAPGPLLGAYGRLRGPREAGERRLYFPRGTVSLAHARTDHGTVVPAELSAPVCALIEAELLRRSSADGADRYEVALLDEGLADLIAPFAERAAARTLVCVPRGSRQRLPAGERLRLFLHWMQPEHLRVDLDLSVALYDEHWRFTGLCDYTNLVHGDREAVHSGDYVSAPPPDGATEFVDLDLGRLAASASRYAVMIVFSYNDVAFEQLTDAFTGFMDLGTTPAGGRHFHPRAVRQRLDLVGDAKVCVPMIIDLAERRYTWTDLNTGADGGFHSVYRHQAEVGALSRDVLAHFSPENRATLWDVACARAAATADEVVVRGRDGDAGALRWRRRDGEGVEAFAARLRGLREPDGPGDLSELLSGRRAFVALVDGDVPAPEKLSGALYRLYPGPIDAAPEALERLTAGDLVAALAPRPPGRR
ncbi:MXAN_6230/SCO0854 family RING domain-containing protein [Kitasatospora sp. NPDC097643]|uniref:MXAN_6230/SCO0854 family RING domain-containing protein n=1 Tax=Kitasatospora sp. NPDC097643 TaxID=3157230 RepID=UPI003317558E